MAKRLFTKRIHKNYLIYFFQQIFILKLLFDIILVSNLRYLKLCYPLLTDDQVEIKFLRNEKKNPKQNKTKTNKIEVIVLNTHSRSAREVH